MFEDSSYASACSIITLQSNKNGFFQEFADNVIQQVGCDWLLKFGKLEKNTEKIKKIYQDDHVYQSVYCTLNNVQEMYRTKCARMALEKRREAELFFNNGNLERSLLLYNQSVIRAPINDVDGQTLSLALWGRSEVLFHLQRYKVCLADIKMCLKEQLPTQHKLEAYFRMAECYFQLDCAEKATLALRVLEKMALRSEYSKVSTKWKKEVQMKIELMKNSEKPELNFKEKNIRLPLLTNGEHTDLSGASKLLKLAYSKTQGHYMVAASPIKTGDTLLAEEPYVSCLLTEKFGTHCHNCFNRIEAVIPCSRCSGIAFCSMECKTFAEQTYHRYECQYMDMMIGSGMSILCSAALRIVTQNSIEYFLGTEKFIMKNQYDTDPHPYYPIYILESHEKERTALDCFRRTLMALFLLAILKKSGYFDRYTDNNAKDKALSNCELLITSILLKNLEILQFNAHEIFETITFKDKTKQPKRVHIGIGLYKTGSFFNHDCYPAIARYFIGKKLVLRSLQPISTDEIVPENYGPTFMKFDVTERRSILKSRYWFHCECQSCVENWPILQNLDESYFYIKCTNTRCSMTFPNSCDVKICPACKTEIKIKQLSDTIHSLGTSFQEALDKVKNAQYEEACESLSSFSDKVHLLCKPPTKNLCLSNEMLGTCWATINGNNWIM